jgi:glycosyltransferase involved in cell wall biosynthesis
MSKLLSWFYSHEIGRFFISCVRVLLDVLIALSALIFLLPAIICSRIQGAVRKKRKPRLLWGSMPINSLYYSSKALKEAGYHSKTVVTDIYTTSDPKNFDVILHKLLATNIIIQHIVDTSARIAYFISSLFSFDIYHFYFDGGVLRNTLFERWELLLLRLSGKKIILFPYGSDAFVYDELSDLSWRHALLVNNSVHGNRAKLIQSRIRRSTQLAHIVVGTIAHISNLPRWDILPVVWFPFDMESVVPTWPSTSGPVRICHAPNHRGAKGTEYLIQAVTTLKNQGVDIELDLIEGVGNDEAITRMAKADIVLDQLLVGYALTAIEGLALGKIVISGMEDEYQYKVFSRNSYLDECPIITASPESIRHVLEDLIQNREQWPELGKKSRNFAEKRHSLEASSEMWEKIYSKVWWGKDVDLINFYSPHVNSDD